MSVADEFEAGGIPFDLDNPGNGTAGEGDESSTTQQPQGGDQTDELPVVQTMEDGVAYGYQCAKLVEDNTVLDIPLMFFLDLSFPIGSEAVALLYVQEQLIASTALHYGISNGQRCENPTLTGDTWLVQILSKTTDWTRETLFDSCRQLKPDTATNECFVYQAIVTGSVLDGSMDDVMKFMQNTLESESLTSSSPFEVAFLGVPQSDPVTGGDNTGRDNLGGNGTPSGVAQAQTANEPPSDRQTVTIVGGFLVAAFGIAFLGVGFVLWRRRQDWLRRRDLQLDLDLNQDKNHPTHDTREDEDDDDEYGQAELRQDLYGDEDEENHHIELDSQGQVNEKITFDLGTSFKDQLMGVYGRGGGGGPSNKQMQLQQQQQPFRPSSRPLETGGGLYNGAGRNGLGSDLASEISDADSWAQTEGTIGSLEHVNLEPITAEV